MLKVIYIRREVWKRILPLQAIPLIAVYICVAISTKSMAASSPSMVQAIFFVGLLLYVATMAFMVRCLTRPIVLSISINGKMTWRPGFSTFEIDLPAGQQVSIDQSRIDIFPSVGKIPASSEKNDVTSIALPSGVEVICDSKSFVIKAREAGK